MADRIFINGRPYRWLGGPFKNLPQTTMNLFEEMCAAGEFEEIRERLSERTLTRRQLELTKSRNGLQLTQSSVNAWADVAMILRDEPMQRTCEALVLASAKDDWGEETRCQFDRNSLCVRVSHPDGRVRVLRGSTTGGDRGEKETCAVGE